VPSSWKLHEVARLSVKFVLFALFSRQRLPDVRMMLKGVADGIRGRTGKLREPVQLG
jgi:rhamnosyltransferase